MYQVDNTSSSLLACFLFYLLHDDHNLHLWLWIHSKNTWGQRRKSTGEYNDYRVIIPSRQLLSRHYCRCISAVKLCSKPTRKRRLKSEQILSQSNGQSSQIIRRKKWPAETILFALFAIEWYPFEAFVNHVQCADRCKFCILKQILCSVRGHAVCHNKLSRNRPIARIGGIVSLLESMSR
jgi:hypothetical protein